jgi:hypothetical protein
MAYFLGRDVIVALTNEDGNAAGDGATGDFIISLAGVATHKATGDLDTISSPYHVVIAGPRCNNGSTSVFGTQTVNSIETYSNEVSDLTGLDLGIGATDEDISYFGQRTVLKAEIKKETTVSLTRKKSDDTWDALFNGARSGLSSTGLAIRDSLSGAPDDVNYGYRLHVKMKNGTEIFVVRNCCVTGHTISLNVDGTTEETMEFVSYVDPLIVDTDAETYAATSAGDL